MGPLGIAESPQSQLVRNQPDGTGTVQYLSTASGVRGRPSDDLWSGLCVMMGFVMLGITVIKATGWAQEDKVID